MVRQTEPTRVVVWMMILALWAFYAGWINLRGNPLGEPGLASPCRNSLLGGGDRRIRFHGDGTALQILQPDPGFQLRLHFSGLRGAVIRLAAP